MTSQDNLPSVYPTLRYRDARAALAFLAEAFGMVPGEITEAPGGRVAHALVGWRDGAIMLSSRAEEPSPFDPGPACLYLAAPDPDRVHARASAAGAEIVLEPVDQPYGSREFAARDPEGNLWCFGTYQPAAPILDHRS